MTLHKPYYCCNPFIAVQLNQAGPSSFYLAGKVYTLPLKIKDLMNDYKMVEVKLNKGNTSPERSERTNYCEETKGVQIEEIILKPQEVATFTLSIEGYMVKMAAYNDSKKSETLINKTINSLVCFCGDRRAYKNIFAIQKGG